MKNKKLMTMVGASALAVTSIIGMGATAFAADNTSTTQAKALTAADIAQHDSNRKLEMQTQLDAAVKAGKITSAQENKILDFFENNKLAKPDESATEAERKAAMDAFKNKVEKFASDNNISIELLRPAHGPGGSGSPGGPGKYNESGGPGSPGEGRTPPTKAERISHMTTQLDSLVRAGTITSDQRAKILEYLNNESEPTFDSDVTQDQRRSEMESRRTAFETFLTSLGLDKDILRPEKVNS